MNITKEKIKELIMEEINQELANLEEQQVTGQQISEMMGKVHQSINSLRTIAERHNEAIIKLMEDVRDIKRGR